jgi:excinuclease ABC subunit C
VECYDISNIQGTSAVGSMVVFEGGQPKNSEYRRFKIKTVEGSNDFAMMQEVLRRRFKRAVSYQQTAVGDEPSADDDQISALSTQHPAPDAEDYSAPSTQTPEPSAEEQSEAETASGWATMPDLVIVDGGKGQLNAALEVLDELGLASLSAVGLAKENEEIFQPGISAGLMLPRTSQALYLVQRIRDEAHRFAITYHRKVRSKKGFRSALDEIPGVGPKRKQALIKQFGSLKAIRDA